MGCLGSVFRFFLLVVCLIPIICFGFLSIYTFFSALFGGNWIAFGKVFFVWLTLSYIIGWLFDVPWKDTDMGDSFLGIVLEMSSIIVYRGVNRVGRLVTRS